MLLNNYVFGEAFTRVTDEWRERTGKKLADLAYETGIRPKDISRYRSGVTIPTKERLLKLCEYLEVSPSVFGYDERRERVSILDQANDRYSSDENYMRRFIEAQKSRAKDLGLSEDFLRWIKQLDATKRMFPLHRPHVHNIMEDDGYRRMKFEEMTAPDVDSPYQVEIEGKTYTLRLSDYAFISELEKYLADCTEFFFYRRNREMQLEDDFIAKRTLHQMEDGSIQFTPLTEEELEEEDPYRHFIFKKERRSK